jgi:hypothetical protein
MGKEKQRDGSKARQGKKKLQKQHRAETGQLTARAANLRTPRGAAQKKPKKRASTRFRRESLDDIQIEQVAGIPDEAQILESAGDLSAVDRSAFARTRRLLAQHLGSHAAARLWLITPSPGFVTTPLDAVSRGKAKVVLAMVEAQLGPSPTYA